MGKRKMVSENEKHSSILKKQPTVHDNHSQSKPHINEQHINNEWNVDNNVPIELYPN